MKRSDQRILTTHVGSLPRTPALRDLLVRQDRGEKIDAATLAREAEAAVRHVVARQLEAGVDVGNDGEQPRVGFSTYPAKRNSRRPRCLSRRTQSPRFTVGARSISPAPRPPFLSR